MVTQLAVRGRISDADILCRLSLQQAMIHSWSRQRVGSECNRFCEGTSCLGKLIPFNECHTFGMPFTGAFSEAGK